MDRENEIPTVKDILELVESQHEPEVVESVKAAIRTWLIWAPESFPGMEPRMRAIAEQWIRESKDIEFKPPYLKVQEVMQHD